MENIRSNRSDTDRGLGDAGVILGCGPGFLNDPDNSPLCAPGWHAPTGNHNNLLPSPGGRGARGSFCKLAPNSGQRDFNEIKFGKRETTLFWETGKKG